MKKKAAAAMKASAPKTVVPKYPRHSLEKVLRIPKAILDQNSGKECSDEDTATFLNIKYNKGPYALELRTRAETTSQIGCDGVVPFGQNLVRL